MVELYFFGWWQGKKGKSVNRLNGKMCLVKKCQVYPWQRNIFGKTTVQTLTHNIIMFVIFIYAQINIVKNALGQINSI